MCECSEMDRHDYGPCGENCGGLADLPSIFGVPDMPPVTGFKPVRDDYTAGFANGVEAVRDWLSAIPKIEMPTGQPDVVSIHDMSAIEAAMHLNEIIEAMKAKS